MDGSLCLQHFFFILVNGSLTKDFIGSKGLRQGDMLSPFFFAIVGEGLDEIVSKVKEKGLFKGMKCRDDIEYNILQFVSDTILTGECNWKNLWNLKAIFRGFELVSELKVNSYKSKIYGINTSDSFLEAGEDFLSCCDDKIPFKFLGILVGSNPRRLSSWLGVINFLKSKLSLWKGKFLSIGGRINLLNSTLNSIPIYTLSFYKAPKAVLRWIISIQSRFLRQGDHDKNRITWVSWNSICKYKKEGCLGVKDISLVNEALLAKCKWRFLHDRNAVWKGILEFRYGHLVREAFSHSSSKSLKTTSYGEEI